MNGRIRVGIDGRTASGKTSLGHELGHAIAAMGRPVLRASLDDFKRPWSERHLYDRESGEGYYRNAFALAAIRKLLLEPAGPDGSGEVVLCLRDPRTQEEHFAELFRAGPDAVTVVDGVFAFRRELNDLWELRIWLEIDPDLAVGRGVARDAAMIGSESEAAELHRDRYAASEDIYVAEADPARAAEVVIDNNDFDAPRLVRSIRR